MQVTNEIEFFHEIHFKSFFKCLLPTLFFDVLVLPGILAMTKRPGDQVTFVVWGFSFGM